MMNAVLRGYLRLRATLYFGRVFEAFYIVLRKNKPNARPSHVDNPFSDFSNVEVGDIQLQFDGTSDRMIEKDTEKFGPARNPIYQSIFPIING
jgi:hypothetical protein